MKIQKYKDIEYSEVRIDELYGDMRIDAQYYDPFYIRNERIIKKKRTKHVSSFMHQPQYGISIAMNEDGIGYKMLKMDDIVGIFASDENAKYAEITEETFEDFELNKFDVLFNRVNSDEFVGRTGIYFLDGEHTFASYLVRITSDNTYANCYLTIFFNCKYGYNCLQRVKRRAVNQANINAQELKALEIPFPSEKLQKQIEILVVEAYNQNLLSQTIYQEAETMLLKELSLDDWQPETVKFKIKDIEYETEDTITKINLSQALQDDRIDAEYWQPNNVSLEEIIKSYNFGYSFVRDICTIYDANIIPESNVQHKYIELANIGGQGDIKDYTFDFGIDLPTRARRLIEGGQIIISSIEGSLSSCALISKDLTGSYCSTGFHVLNSDQINSETLLLLFKSQPYQLLLKKGCSGTILTAINKRFLSKIPVPKVNTKIQKLLKTKVSKCYRTRQHSKHLLETAKIAVEIFIEVDEKAALEFINKSVKT